MRVLLALLLVGAVTASGQEIRKAIPVEQPVRKAIAIEPEQGQEFHFDFVPNTYMPADTVELSAAHVVQEGEFYPQPSGQ